MKKQIIIFIALILFISGAISHAATLYTTFGPGNSYDTHTGLTIGSPADYLCMQSIADPFAVSTSARLDSIDVAVQWLRGPNELIINIAQDKSGIPSNNIIESFHVNILMDSEYHTPSIYTVYSSIHPILDPSSKYWICLTVPDLSNSMLGWMSTYNNAPGPDAYNTIFTDFTWTYNSNAQTMAFAVNGAAVPEPSAFLLIGCSLAGLALRLRRKSAA